MHRRCLVVLTGLLLACSGPDPTGPHDAAPVDAAPLPDAGPTPDAGATDGGTPFTVGGLRIMETSGAYWAQSWIRGAFLADGAEPWHLEWPANYPQLHWHREIMTEGSCRLLEYVPAFCTSCAGVCVDTEVCQPYPSFGSVGTLTVTGLSVPVTLEPDYWLWYLHHEALPADLYAPGAAITATATGAGIPAFEVTTAGVPAIDSSDVVDDQITLVNDADAVFTWTPADPGSRVRLSLNANNAGHGQPFEAILRCDVPDETGRITVPVALIQAFPATYRWETCDGSDCPPSSLLRYRRASAPVPGGEVELVVGSDRVFWVVHTP